MYKLVSIMTLSIACFKCSRSWFCCACFCLVVWRQRSLENWSIWWRMKLSVYRLPERLTGFTL